MSENFNGKDYSEYFKILEQKLDTSKPSVPVKRESAAISPSVKKRVKKGTYRVFRLRPAAIICTFAVAAALIAALIAVPAIKSRGENKKSDEIKKSTNSATITAEEPENNQIVYNFTDSTAPVPAENDAEAAIVINTETHNIVAAKNEHERLYPASTTKIMTLIVACDNIKNFSDTFTMTLDITDPLFIEGASVAGFLNQEEISMTDLLYGMILPSGADAAMGLAVKIAGSEKAFAELMNDKVKELGLEDTHFVNVSGLYDEEQYTTAYDMAVILETAISNPLCRKILSTYQYTTAPTPQHPEGINLTSTLFDYMYGTEPETATIEGGKTGFVNEAGYCIASFGTNNTTKNEYIVVTLKNSARSPAVFGQIDLYRQFVK